MILRQLCSRRSFLSATLLVVMLSFCSGCRTHEGNFSRIINEPAPVPGKVRASFGRVGILLTGDNPDFGFKRPATPSEAVVPIMDKTFAPIDRSANDASILAFGLIVSGVVGVVGSYVVGVPESEIKDAESSLRKPLIEAPLETQIQNRVVQIAARRKIPQPGSVTVKNISRRPTGEELRAISVLGLDSLLVIRVFQQRFEELHGLNPPMTFAVTVDVEVLRVSDGVRLHRGELEYRGRKLKFTEWAEHRAKPFRSEMERVTRTTAAVIVDQLLAPGGTTGK